MAGAQPTAGMCLAFVDYNTVIYTGSVRDECETTWVPSTEELEANSEFLPALGIAEAQEIVQGFLFALACIVAVKLAIKRSQ